MEDGRDEDELKRGFTVIVNCDGTRRDVLRTEERSVVARTSRARYLKRWRERVFEAEDRFLRVRGEDSPQDKPKRKTRERPRCVALFVPPPSSCPSPLLYTSKITCRALFNQEQDGAARNG